MSASLIGPSGSSTFDYPSTMSMSLAGSCFSRNRHRGLSIMGSEDEAEQSLAALPAVARQVQADIRTHSSIVPRHLPPLGGALVFSYRVGLNGFHAATAACSRVTELVPSTQMRCRITASRRTDYDRLFHPAAPGNLHGPRARTIFECIML